MAEHPLIGTVFQSFWDWGGGGLVCLGHSMAPHD